MPITVKPLHPLFAAEMLGADLTLAPAPALIDAVEAAMTKYGVLVIRDQLISDEDHIRFSRAFGPLELPPDYNQTGGRRRMAREVSDVSNLTIDTGEILPADALKRETNKGAQNFHMDSFYSPLPLKWSLLLGHEVPPENGDTEFVDCRAAYERLTPGMKERVENLDILFDYYEVLCRQGVIKPTPQRRAAMPARQYKLVQTAPDGRKSLFIGSSGIASIVGMDKEEGAPLLDRLYRMACDPDYVYAHKWRKGDLAIWDNRCMLHRATEFDSFTYRRDVRRTTIHASGPEMTLLQFDADQLL